MNKVTFFLIILCCVSSIHSLENTPKLNDLHWLAGQWTGQMGNNLYMESWTINPAGRLEGKAYMKNHNGDIIFSEVLRIDEIGNHIVYIVSVNNSNPVLFTLIEVTYKEGSPAWVFKNQEHDFPQSITYRKKSPNSLHARVAGVQNGKKEYEEFLLKRANRNTNK